MFAASSNFLVISYRTPVLSVLPPEFERTSGLSFLDISIYLGSSMQSAMNAPDSLVPLISGRLDLQKYQRLMSYPAWNYFTQSITATRDYDNGLDACLILLQCTEENRDDLTAKAYERNLQL